MNTKSPETHEFQAEVKQVLDIVIHSLYTDKDIFIRELVSNASDALEKLRHLQLTEKDIFDDHLPLEIKITTDDQVGTLTIQDFGIGMTHEELIQNLGTIAHSGSKKFLEALKANNHTNQNLIGQFGVGFYSVFMVASSVEVYTRSWKADAESLLWTSEGAGTYKIESSSGQRRGCKLVIKLKEDCKTFAQANKVKDILKRYSQFVPFPIHLNNDIINTVQPLWLQSKSTITEDAYKAFYKFHSNTEEEPLNWLHFNADAPRVINALLFIPKRNSERLGWGKIDSNVGLYCRKILIDNQPKGLLPDWLRFLSGVIDSADLPLNISRENMQDSRLLQELGHVITRRFIKHLEDLASQSSDLYLTFWKQFGYFIKEGLHTDFKHTEKLTALLRFESTLTEAGTLTSLEDYTARMQANQKEIYFLATASKTSLQNSPYLEAFKARGLEVLLLNEPIDAFIMQQIGRFEEKAIVSIERDDITLEALTSESEKEPLDAIVISELCEWMQKILGTHRVEKVSSGERLTSSPVIALSSDKSMPANMRKLLKAMQQEASNVETVHLQINPKHALIKKLAQTKNTNPELATEIAHQLLDNALMQAGLLEDPQAMIERSYLLLEKL